MILFSHIEIGLSRTNTVFMSSKVRQYSGTTSPEIVDSPRVIREEGTVTNYYVVGQKDSILVQVLTSPTTRHFSGI